MKALHKVLNVQLKTAIRLLEEVHALDTFQWFTGIITDDGQEDIPVGVPIFILHDWGKRSAEARSSHCAVLP